MRETSTPARRSSVDFPDGMLEAMSGPWFAEIATRIEKGVHIGPEDGDLHRALMSNQAAFRAFYEIWGAEIVRAPEDYVYLLPSSAHFGERHLDTAQMLVGQALAHYLLDPASIDSPVTAAQIASHIEHRLGSQERYFREFAPRQRGAIPEAERQMRATERVITALRVLATMGFCDLLDEADPEAMAVRPRRAALRFAQPSIDSGGTEEGLLRGIRSLVEQTRASSASPAGDDSAEED